MYPHGDDTISGEGQELCSLGLNKPQSPGVSKDCPGCCSIIQTLKSPQEAPLHTPSHTATAPKHLVTPRSHAWLKIRHPRPLQVPLEGSPSWSVLGISSWLPATPTPEAKVRPISLVAQREETRRPSSRPQASPSLVLSDLVTTQHRGRQGLSPRRQRPRHSLALLPCAAPRGSRAWPHPHQGPGSLPTPSCLKGMATLEPGASTSDGGQGVAAGEGPLHAQEQPGSVHQSLPRTPQGEAWPRPHQASCPQREAGVAVSVQVGPRAQHPPPRDGEARPGTCCPRGDPPTATATELTTQRDVVSGMNIFSSA